MSGVAWNAPCGLYAVDEKHVAAVHEAAHAVAVDRVGGTLGRVCLIAIGASHWDGETQQAVLSADDDHRVARNDRVIALCGPSAERRFTGEAARGGCDDDFATAEAITDLLKDDGASVAAAVLEALNGDAVWQVILTVACDLIEAVPGVGPDPAQLHAIVRDRLGDPPAEWP